MLAFWTAPFLGLYVPASYTLFGLQAWISGAPDPRVFHTVSTLLHGASAFLVVRILARLGARPVAAALGGLLFAVHPLQVESVAWISEQRGLLAAVFGLGALTAYVHPERSARRDVLAAVLLAAALLAKPSAAVFPALALVLEAGMLRRGMRFAAPRLAVGFALSAACLVVTKTLQSDDTVKDVVAVPERLLVAADALEFYARKVLVPIGLCADHGRRPSLVVAHGVDGSLVLTLALAAVALGVPALRRHALVPLLLVLAALAPVLGLAPFGHQEISTVADRYAYLALLGPALLVARLASGPASGPVRAIGGAAAAVLAALSFAQSVHWRDTEAVFARVLEVNPRSWVARTNRGLALQARRDLDGAEREYRAALDAKPDHARALNNLGLLAAQRGRTEEAQALLQRAIDADPRYARPHMNLAAIHGNAGRFDAAESSARRAVELAPEDPTMRTTLGNVALRQRRTGEARAEFEAALRLRPRDVEAWYGLGLVREMEGDRAGAAEDVARALEFARVRSPARVELLTAELRRLQGP
jgi:Tfp pilus assembly protein PilF